MKMFKKLMAVALVGVMALSMLTGCAVTNAIAEDKAEKALENAYKTVTGETVNFKSLSVGSSVTSPVKADIKNGTILLKDGETYAKTVKSGDKVYTVVVATEPKSATKIENWKHTAFNVMMAAIKQGIHIEGTNDKTAKVNVIVDLEGKDKTDNSKKDTYAMFVFAADKATYNK
mgnify:CR=1 FL=1